MIGEAGANVGAAGDANREPVSKTALNGAPAGVVTGLNRVGVGPRVENVVGIGLWVVVGTGLLVVVVVVVVVVGAGLLGTDGLNLKSFVEVKLGRDFGRGRILFFSLLGGSGAARGGSFTSTNCSFNESNG